MEATPVIALRRIRCYHAAAARQPILKPLATGSRVGCDRVSVRPRGITGAGFADEGHLRYYAPPARCGGEKERKEVAKRRARLIEGLAALQTMGGGLGLAVAGGEPEAGKMTSITEGADVLLSELELLRAKDKEMKKKEKKQKKEMKMKMKACVESENSEDQEEMKRNKMEQKAVMETTVKKMGGCGGREDSSSESSDSDCEEEVVDMNNLRTTPLGVEPVIGKPLVEKPPEEEVNVKPYAPPKGAYEMFEK